MGGWAAGVVPVFLPGALPGFMPAGLTVRPGGAAAGAGELEESGEDFRLAMEGLSGGFVDRDGVVPARSVGWGRPGAGHGACRPGVTRRPVASQAHAMAKYGKKARQEVAKALHEEQRGQLRSGRSGKKVTDPKQAIAIGLSRARKAGAKLPDPPERD